jgi:hypothetical protein
MFRIEIDTGNAAFDDGNRDAEIARLLSYVVHRLERGGITVLPLYDINGNRVGKAESVP